MITLSFESKLNSYIVSYRICPLFCYVGPLQNWGDVAGAILLLCVIHFLSWQWKNG